MRKNPPWPPYVILFVGILFFQCHTQNSLEKAPLHVESFVHNHFQAIERGNVDQYQAAFGKYDWVAWYQDSLLWFKSQVVLIPEEMYVQSFPDGDIVIVKMKSALHERLPYDWVGMPKGKGVIHQLGLDPRRCMALKIRDEEGELQLRNHTEL